MITDTALSVKPLGQAMPGELVQVTIGPAPALAIVTEQGSKETGLGVLRSSQEGNPYPFHTSRNSSSNCLSYGLEWYIAPIIDLETWAGNSQKLYWAGSLHLSSEGWIIMFPPHPSSHDNDLHFNLDTGLVCEQPHKAFPVSEWTIYRSRASFERKDPNLLQIKAVDFQR